MSSLPVAANSQFAVVIFGQPASPHVVAELLVDVAKLAPTDALIHSRYAPGVLPDRLDRATAERLVNLLQGIGLHAEVIEPVQLLNFHAAHAVHHAEILVDGLQLITERGTADGLVSWDRVSVISTGLIPLESTLQYDWNDEHFFATARRSHHEPHRAMLPPVMQLWLVVRGEAAPIHIDQTRMNYETLGAAKTDSSTENFRIFLNRLVERAPHAHVTSSTRAYLDHASVLKYAFTSSDELQRTTQLHALIADQRETA